MNPEDIYIIYHTGLIKHVEGKQQCLQRRRFCYLTDEDKIASHCCRRKIKHPLTVILTQL